MEDLSTWSVDRLIQLHTDMDALDKDLFKVSRNFYQKQESIRINNRAKIGYNACRHACNIKWEKVEIGK